MMTSFVACILICSATIVGAANVKAQGSLRHVDASHGFVKAIEFKHRLRVCNAYAHSGELDIFRGKAEKLTGEAPMPYKSCRDFVSPLKAGDKLDFKFADSSAGSFSVSDLPNNDAVLLLVISRHDALSTAVSFESHVFANLPNAQVAVIDTYKGSKTGMPKIMDAKAAKASRSEDLRYDSVIAVSPGIYEVALSGVKGAEDARKQLVALDHESYVVFRTGVEATHGPSYAEDLVVFPASDSRTLHSAAVATKAPAVALLLVSVVTVVFSLL